MKEVKKKVLMIAVVLMAIAMLATPVMATAPEEFLLTLFGGYPLDYPPPERLWESGNMKHMRGVVGTVPQFWIVWGPVFPPWPPAPGTYLKGSSTRIWSYDINTETMKGVAHVDIEIVLTDGTFEGTSVLHGEFEFWGDNSEYASLFTGTAHGVLHGTGAYVGWKIDIYREVVDGVSEREVYLYKR